MPESRAAIRHALGRPAATNITARYAGAMPDDLHEPAHPGRAGAIAATTARAPGDCVFLLDFDGTLAPITEHADQARPVEEARSALRELVGVGADVGIVSARPVAFLREHLDVAGVSLYGVYGLEVLDRGGVSVDPRAAEWMPVVRDLVKAASADLGPRGVYVEDKSLSVALHYRTAPGAQAAVSAWAAAKAAETGLSLQPGRMVVELRPPHDRDKGSVVAEHVGAHGCAWYFGDDRADLAAFGMLSRFAADRPGFLPVRVAIENTEGGRDLAAAADFTVESPHGVVDLIRDVVRGWTR